MEKFYYIILNFCIIVFLSTNLSAKEFKVISLSNFEKLEGIKFQDESASQTIGLKQYAASRSFPVPSNNLIHFYGIDSETGVSSKKPVLRLPFDDQNDDVLILLRNDENNSDKINFEFLKNDSASFPNLSALILNFSNNEVVAKLGDGIVKILPNSRKLVQLSKDDKSLFSDKVLFAKQENDQSINYFFISYWRILPESKILCIIEAKDDLNTDSLKEILL